MADYEKIDEILTDKRVQPRSKLIIALLVDGYSLQEVIHFPLSKIEELKDVENGEHFFVQYALGEGVLEKIRDSKLLFPNTTNNKPMKKDSILRAVRRACKINGYQLHQLKIDGLVGEPTWLNEMPSNKEGVISFDDIVNLLKRK